MHAHRKISNFNTVDILVSAFHHVVAGHHHRDRRPPVASSLVIGELLCGEEESWGEVGEGRRVD